MGTKASLPSAEAITSWPVMPPSGTDTSTLPLAGSMMARLCPPFSATRSLGCCAVAKAPQIATTVRDRKKWLALNSGLRKIPPEYIVPGKYLRVAGPGIVGAEAPAVAFGILDGELAAAVVGVLKLPDDFATGSLGAGVNGVGIRDDDIDATGLLVAGFRG